MKNFSLVFASSNTHKIEEVGSLLGPGFKISGLKELNIHEDIEENGSSFRENARIKAQYVFEKTQKDVFADDSGLEIDFLKGAPGIYSARYSGSRDMQTNLRKVLSDLGSTENRSARFTCSLCLIYQGRIEYFDGHIEGEILFSPQGEQGFGYDPIFKPKGYDKSFSELGQEIKNNISHRALAIQALKTKLFGELSHS